MPRRFIIATLSLVAATPAAAEVAHPLKVPTTSAIGPIFADPKTILEDHKGVKTKWYEMLASKDKKMSAGVYESGATRDEIASYGEDEFMYFLKGTVTLTSADGTITNIKAGDAVTIPKGWKGVWDTPGYTKYYVTYESAE